jgi:hypothetical protein
MEPALWIIVSMIVPEEEEEKERQTLESEDEFDLSFDHGLCGIVSGDEAEECEASEETLEVSVSLRSWLLKRSVSASAQECRFFAQTWRSVQLQL